ncbi:MAG: hypothetical protein V3R99_04840 [Thermoguttaceae bacterium]
MSNFEHRSLGRLSSRFFQALLIAAATGFSWLMMMAVHEFGHVLHAWLSGGRVVRVVLDPLSFSRTDVLPNPHPLWVAIGGAVWGCLIPLGLLALVRITARRYTYLAAYFAGFCLIANGVYLAAGSFFPGADDAGVAMHHGAARWHLLALGVPATGAGLYLLNGLGPHFGLGTANGEVDRKAAVGATVAMAIVVVVEMALSR